MAKYLEAIEKLPEEFRFPVMKAFELLREELAETVKISDFEELKAVVKELAEAQKRTEESLETFKKATEDNFNKVWKAINELAEAQKRTELRVEELAEAQKRTELSLESFKKATEENFNKVWKAIDELAEAQKRTELKVEELAEAQKRTEEEIKRLTKEQIKIKEELGGLSHTVGYRLEDEAFKALPSLLKDDFGITVIGKLKRDFIEIGPEKYIEVNIWGEGKKDGKEFAIVGEAKSQLKKKDIDDFLKKLEVIKRYIPKEQFPILVTYIAHPQIQRYAKEKNIKIYFSYEF